MRPRRVLLAALLAVVAAGAAGAVRHAFDALGTRNGEAVELAAGDVAASRAHSNRPARGAERLRREPRPISEDDPAPTARTDGVDDAATRARDSGGDWVTSGKFGGAATTYPTLPTLLDRSKFVLPAAKDRDAVTGEAPAVAPGRPNELPLAAFLARGYASVNRVAELVGERRPEVEEGVAVSISGRVIEKDGGAPIAGARVVVTSTFYVRRYFYDQHLSEVARVETDAEGAYRIERVNVDPAHFGQGGRLFVTVTADGHAPALAVALKDVSPGVANRLKDVQLQHASQSLQGRVLDMWEGKPVAGARVYATGAVEPATYPKDERAALFVGAPTTTTDAEGRFLLAGLGEGIQTISVHGGDDCVGAEAVVLPHECEIVMHTRQIRGRIEGTTFDAAGHPVALVTIEGGDNSTHSFADGHFVLENFRGDVVTIRFTHPDFAPTVMEGVRDGAAGLVVRMERPRPEIVLAVEDADTSAPVTRVRLELAFAEGSPAPAATSPDRLAADGRYALRLPEGAASVRVSADGHRAETLDLAHRTGGEVVRLLLAAETR